MAILMEIWVWLAGNYVGVFVILGGAVSVAEAVVRVTPTKADDGAVERIGKTLKKIMDLLRIPNVTIDEQGKLTTFKKK